MAELQISTKRSNEELKNNSGKIELKINRDGNIVGLFTFNPYNLKESQKHAEIVENIEKEQPELLKKAKNVDENGTALESINFRLEFIEDLREKIDNVYGEGTSELLFGDCYSEEMIIDFFEQLKPYYEKASKERKAKYKNNK